MLIRPMLMGLPAAVGGIVSALKFTAAGSGWSISPDGYTATRDTSAGDTLAVANISRSTGPAAVSWRINNTPDGGTIGLNPAPVPTSNVENTVGRMVWTPAGVIIANDAVLYSGDPAKLVAGDVITMSIDAAGTGAKFLKNGTLIASATVSAISRTPSVRVSGSALNVTMNGAPAGYSPWAA